MKKSTRFLVAGLLTVSMFLGPVLAIAQEKSEKPKTPPAGSAPEKPGPVARTIPVRGNVAAVDKDANTVTVGKQVFHISSETKVTKGNQAATIADLAVGDAIAGNYTKADDGKLTAKMVRVGPKPGGEPTEKKTAEKKKESKTAE